MSEDAAPLRPVPILATLARHRVRFVVIGSFGAILQDVDLPMTDMDVVPDISDPDNLRRLAAALTDLDARERDATDHDTAELHREMAADPKFLTSAKFWTFDTTFGGLDLVLRPAGFDGGYDDLVGSAKRMRVADDADPGASAVALVADVRDIYHSKRVAGRLKDTKTLRLFVGIHDPDPRRTLAEQYRAGRAAQAGRRQSTPVRWAMAARGTRWHRVSAVERGTVVAACGARLAAAGVRFNVAAEGAPPPPTCPRCS